MALVLFIALALTAISAQLTKANVRQSYIAQSLLSEHQQVASISYRMFKQLTDELIFGENANQAEVRKKQEIIQQSFKNIRRLEQEQRDALGEEATQGTIEDTDELQQLLDDIVAEFKSIVKAESTVPLEQQERLRSLLEVTIDNQFREAINAAVLRQTNVVTALNTRVETLNTSLVWFSFGLGILTVPLIVSGCYWLFNQLYKPLQLIITATNTIADGNYDSSLSENFDDEFNALAKSINQLSRQLKEHQINEAKSRERLAYEVKQRTGELTEANLELTRIDNRRRQFIADVSHELRTPLTIIRGEAQVTLRLNSANEDDYKETLQTILEQAVGLSNLVDDLLLLTRAEMNQISLDITSVPLVSLLESEVNLWRKQVGNRTINLNINSELAEINLLVDKPRVHQVLSILLDNAVKYSGNDTNIDVVAEQTQESVRITVRDFGKGISAAEKENIFERFVRFSKHHQGLGLGLPIAKVIVETHGGVIGVDTLLGEGAAFYFTLPKEGTT